jgi:hypothetical protein
MWPARLRPIFATTLGVHRNRGGSVIDLADELEAHRSLGCCRPGRGDSRDTTLLEHIRSLSALSVISREYAARCGRSAVYDARKS